MKKNNDINFYKVIPVIIQEDKTGEVLMLVYMSVKALRLTKQSGFVWFWSRRRKKLWKKGEESGNRLKVKCIYNDCDQDALLIKVDLIGKYACHRKTKSCFSQIKYKI